MGDLQAASWWWLVVAAGFLLDWIAIAMDWNRIKPFTKPLAMVLVILWTMASVSGVISQLLGLLLAAQVFGLLGDILLLLPDKAFSTGLGAFLIGHILYIALLFNRISFLFTDSATRLKMTGLVFGGLIILWVGLLVLFYWIFKRLACQEGISGFLWLGIQAYAWVLSGMAVLALVVSLLFDGPTMARVILPVGALLFLLSDFLLTYNRFVKSFERAQLWVRITYHLAQFGLAWGFLAVIAV
jgi:uncharacterized membrane protein YhhN